MVKPIDLDDVAFGKALHTKLSPSDAIQTPELLRGRADQLSEIRQALFSAGRQIFIYGDRGVGKTSLAQTVAFQHQSSERNPILVGCSPDSTCFSIARDIAREAFPTDPRTAKQTKQNGMSLSFKGVGAETRNSEEKCDFKLPESLNEAIRLLNYVAQNHSGHPVVVVDEFDQISNKNEQIMFANLVKQVADKKVRLVLIFCGIGTSLDDLFNAHLSAPRYFHPVKLERLSYEARFEIVDSAAEHLGITVDNTTRWRIPMISDGFPHYVHLICEKLFWKVYLARNGGHVTGDLFEQALASAAEALEPELKKPYEKATKKYSNVREPILWAATDSDLFQRPSREVWQSYLRIMEELRQPPIDRTKFNSHMNEMKKPASGSILKGSRAGWYEYTEKVVRGYARLRAMQHGILLEREHPLQQKRYGRFVG
jgi:KaiC/GvpD/RAD55 family RecA-like ATPase